MRAGSAGGARPRRGRRKLPLLAIGLGLALLVGANAHLLYVAFASAPDCVPHARAGSGGGTFHAARSAC